MTSVHRAACTKRLGYTRVEQDNDSLSIERRRAVGQLEILLILNEPGHLHSLEGYNTVDLGDDVREWA
jgi:hypothetical protein